MNMIMVSTDYARRNAEAIVCLLRAYAEGVAFIHHIKDRALKIIAKYAHLAGGQRRSRSSIVTPPLISIGCRVPIRKRCKLFSISWAKREFH